MAFLWSGIAHAVPRYLVEDSSNVIKAYTEDDALLAPPGHTAVNASDIEAVYTGTIYQGGTWVVTGGVGVYTPPTGIVVPFDGGTDTGALQLACVATLDVFDIALDYIHSNRAVWTHEGVKRATDGIHWMVINMSRVALNAVANGGEPAEILRGSGILANRGERERPRIRGRDGRIQRHYGRPFQRLELGESRI